MAVKTRFLKWVGMPPVLQADGFRVHNWQYENRRPVQMVMPEGSTGRTNRVLEAGTLVDHEGNRVKLSHSYEWRQSSNLFVTEVTFTDAMAIMTACPFEFVDVTEMDRAEWPKVRNQPIIMEQTA